ncbi:MAG: glycosyltransferase family protein [Chitinophagales bacterium]
MIAPLDWGLGHATRCIPIIRYCISRGHEVVLASTGRSLRLLQEEFPQLHSVDMPAYNIYYQKKGSFILKIAVQLGKVLRGIMREHRQTAALVKEHRIDLIISDNRYGVRCTDVPSILITHQMMVKVPGFWPAEWVVYQWLKGRHRKFDQVWIPDAPGDVNIAADLSHARKQQKNAVFIGVLTRFQEPAVMPACDIDVLVILSGPEPQRTVFEEKTIAQLRDAKGLRCVVVRGVSEVKEEYFPEGHIRCIAYADANTLYDLVLRSRIIISRGGYSTLMDLARLHKKCICIPTPGQTEQEYLVEVLAKKNLVIYQTQENMDLHSAIQMAGSTGPFFIDVDPLLYKKAVDSVL